MITREYFFVLNQSNENQRIYEVIEPNCRFYHWYPNRFIREQYRLGLVTQLPKFNRVPVLSESTISFLENIMKNKEYEHSTSKYILYRYKENIKVLCPIIDTPYLFKIRITGDFRKDEEYKKHHLHLIKEYIW